MTGQIVVRCCPFALIVVEVWLELDWSSFKNRVGLAQGHVSDCPGVKF